MTLSPLPLQGIVSRSLWLGLVFAFSLWSPISGQTRCSESVGNWHGFFNNVRRTCFRFIQLKECGILVHHCMILTTIIFVLLLRITNILIFFLLLFLLLLLI